MFLFKHKHPLFKSVYAAKANGFDAAHSLALCFGKMKKIVIRHPRENIKKCSLRHLHGRADFEFYKAAKDFTFDASGCTLLEMGAKQISPADAARPIVLLDSTWKLLPSLRARIFGNFEPRSLPDGILTAYPRVSKLFDDPLGGLATVEALYAALRFAGEDDPSILDGYHFAEKFLSMNGWLGGKSGAAV